MCVLSIKVPIRKKSGNLLCAPCMTLNNLMVSFIYMSNRTIIILLNTIYYT